MDPATQWVVLGTVFLSVFGLSLGIAEWRTSSQRVQRRLHRLTEDAPFNVVDTDPSFRTAGRKDYLPALTKVLRQQGLSEKIRLEMLRAGLLIRPSEYVALIVVSTALFFLSAVMLTGEPSVIVLMLVIGAGGPVGMVKLLQQIRHAKFEQQLADALTLIASSLRSGYSFLRSLQMVSHEMPPPIAHECQRVLLEVEVGVPIEEALWRWVDRMQSYDLDLAVTAVIIQLQVGGNLSDILDTISETIRERIRIKGEIAALTAEGRLTGTILFFAPFVLGGALYLQNPGYLQPLFASPIGVPLIVMALTLQIVGGLVIKRMLSFDV
ncbi:MAG: type II secretion system F family protein [Armatimonadetes bacterium]|nr:type II secretion system F family protein [Armatimonadota bacterium]